MTQLSIVIVNYKNQDLITDCVRSIVEKETKLNYEIIIVDNHSEDEAESKLKAIYPELKWIQMGYNSGFGRANNEGLRAAKGETILMLNSDTRIEEENTLFSCLNQLNSVQNPQKTILGTRLVNLDGSYQESLRLSFPGFGREMKANAFYILVVERLMKRKSEAKKNQQEAHFRSGYVAWINGAFLMVKRSAVLEHTLLFDEDFFLYGEDMEWAWRAKKSGMKFYHSHVSKIIHLGSASSESQKAKVQQVMASDWLYLKKTRGFFYAFFTMTLVWKNQMLDSLLHFFAKMRGKSFSQDELTQKKYRKWTYENLKRFYFPILFRKRHSSERNFKINCYE